MPEPSTIDEMVRQARLVQGRQRIGTHGEYDGKPRDEDTLLFYADTEEQVAEMLRAALGGPRCLNPARRTASANGLKALRYEDKFPETFEDTIGCDMCGAHIDDPCDCFDPQSERRHQ